MKRTIKIILTFLLSLSIMTTFCFASTYSGNVSQNKSYSINSVNELKKEIKASGVNELNKGVSKHLADQTNPDVIKAFVKEKQHKVDEILRLNSTVILEENQQHFEKTYDLGDKCSFTIAFDEERERTPFEKVKDFFITPAYAFSQSGFKTGWQAYGNYNYTATATAQYVLTTGVYSLKVYYTLSASGIQVTNEIATNQDVSLLVIDNIDKGTTDRIATNPGASDCNSYAVFKTTYGHDPIDWSSTHKLDLRIKYLAIDKSGKEINTTREWNISPYAI